jgi:hypothetical protein
MPPPCYRFDTGAVKFFKNFQNAPFIHLTKFPYSCMLISQKDKGAGKWEIKD